MGTSASAVGARGLLIALLALVAAVLNLDCTTTAAFVAFAFRFEDGRRAAADVRPLRLGTGAAATIAAAVLVVTLPNAALPVLVVGVAATALQRLRPGSTCARCSARSRSPSCSASTSGRISRSPARCRPSSGRRARARSAPRPPIATYSLVGLLLVPLTLVAALTAEAVVAQ